MTPEGHRAEGVRLLALSAVHYTAERHDRAQSAAVLGAAHFTAAAATFGMRAMEEVTPPAPSVGPTPDEILVEFLRTVRDEDVRTDNAGQVNIATGSRPAFSFRRIARTAELAGLVGEDSAGAWHLTVRGREAADRGTI